MIVEGELGKYYSHMLPKTTRIMHNAIIQFPFNQRVSCTLNKGSYINVSHLAFMTQKMWD